MRVISANARFHTTSTHCRHWESPLTVVASKPLGGGMNIHKPKPWQGLREFLQACRLIAVGVLTALVAEAGVETRHDARLAKGSGR